VSKALSEKNSNMKEKNKVELLEIINRPIDESIIYGTYHKPEQLIKLEKLVKEKALNLEALGFYLCPWMPYSPQPVDMIPFATTGVDGTYFAFLTDFGAVKKLEEAPIVVYSAAGLNLETHTYSPVLFARSFSDFISICTQVPHLDLIYDGDPRKTKWDMDTILDDFNDEDEMEEHQEVSKILKSYLNLNKIENLNMYYSEFYSERNSKSYIKTKDGLNIFFDGSFSKSLEAIGEILSLEDLNLYLSSSDYPSRLKIYRDYPLLFNYYSNEEFLSLLETFIKYLKNDNHKREAAVLQTNVEKERAYLLCNKKDN
jgi:hypothetical protein